ncbi:SpoIVB peptidase S55 domain-containing protein [Anaerovibrio slackiae]|uniref:SpoIVB peptidase S55 domain-containing protein n=1 Tax=Anaerovibrio slackiae TaxID=2652309 RepID=UPI00386924E5
MHRLFGKMKKRLLAACLSASLLLGSTAMAALPEIISLQDVKPGMWGTGYTVVDSSGEIRPFDVEVVGILGDNSKMSAKRILVNLYGDLIEETGGAISGMSGSPIYFGGRLAGALSAGYKDMYPTQRIMLTPIEDMLRIWQYPDTLNRTKFPQLDLRKLKAEREKFQAAEAKKEADGKAASDEHEDASVAVPDEHEDASVAVLDEHEADPVADTEVAEVQDAAAEAEKDAAAEAEKDAAADVLADTEEKNTYFASGFGSKGMKLLQEGMGRLGMKLDYDNVWDAGASVMQARPDAVLEPGSPVGVALSVGDFSFGAMGTVTAVDDKKILAFGHPYTHRGNVNYFMTDAQVISTIHGPTNGMKLGNVNGIIGRINQDRQDGVGGILGQMPQTVPVIVTVHDRDTGRSVTYNSMLAYDEEVVSVLAPVVVYSSISNTLDRQDGSTASLKFSLRSNYGEKGLIERRNMFYDAEDVAKVSIGELNDILGVILGNKEKEPDLLDLKVDVTVERGRKTATLISAVPSKKDVLPGEKITFDTTIQPYRGEKIKVTVPYTVPKAQAPGNLALDVHGGGLVNVAKILLAQQAAIDAGVNMDEEPPVSIQLQDMLASNCNNEIIIESTVVVPKNDDELKESIKKAKKQAEQLAKQESNNAGRNNNAPQEPAPVNKAATEYIIENIIHTNVNVLEMK